MTTYKDKTWCSVANKCETEPCSARLTDKEIKKAIKWWGNENPPIAYADLSDECMNFKLIPHPMK